jgi:hypothetical protein
MLHGRAGKDALTWVLGRSPISGDVGIFLNLLG